MKKTYSSLDVLMPRWPAPDTVCALTTTRKGGVSKGPYKALNLGAHVDDLADDVAQNREMLSTALALPSQPVWLEQVHGTEIVNLSDTSHEKLVADGAITGQAGIVCCVMTADCLPLFICDAQGDQVAAVHVGWRGLSSGIVERALSLFKAPPAELLAWSGPAISIENFEVGSEVKEQLGGDASAWRQSVHEGKYYADLYALVGQRARQAGVGWYGHENACTFRDEGLYFSHRRDGVSGRLASLIYKK